MQAVGVEQADGRDAALEMLGQERDGGLGVAGAGRVGDQDVLAADAGLAGVGTRHMADDEPAIALELI